MNTISSNNDTDLNQNYDEALLKTEDVPSDQINVEKKTSSLNINEFTNVVSHLVNKKFREQRFNSIEVLEFDSTTRNSDFTCKTHTFKSLLSDISEEISTFIPSDLDSTSAQDDTKDQSVRELRIKDLRRLDFTINQNEEFTIQVRRHAVLLTLDPLRAIITNQKLRLIIPPAFSSEKETEIDLTSILKQYILDWDYDDKNHQNFELHICESLLSTIKDTITLKQLNLSKQILKRLEYVKTGALLSYEFQESLLYLKDQTGKLISKLKTFQSSIEKLINDDETMALMNLHLLNKKPSLYRYPISSELMVNHEEVERIFETYETDFSVILNHLEYLMRQIKVSEIQASLKLNFYENKNWSMTTLLNVIIVNISVGFWLAGIFAMNLDNAYTNENIANGTVINSTNINDDNVYNLQSYPRGFDIVVGGTTFVVFVGCIIGYLLLVYYRIFESEDKVAVNACLQ